MAKKYYSTKVVGIGSQVSSFLSAGKMLVLFDDSMVLPELRNISVHHSGNHINDIIKPGNVFKIDNSEFKIIKVGNDVQNNLKNLGHAVIKFDNGKGELLEGSIHVEDKPIPKIRIGDEISIVEAGSEALNGKTASLTCGDKALCEAVAQILKDNGAKIVDGDADIVIKIK